MDYAYMGFYDLFDHLLEPKKIRDEHADATNVTSIPEPGSSKAIWKSGDRSANRPRGHRSITSGAPVFPTKQGRMESVNFAEFPLAAPSGVIFSEGDDL